jgi:gluconolactonase
VKLTTLIAAVFVTALASTADAHFVLVEPAATLMQNNLGDPQKIAPCGGVSANPGRGTPANPGTPTNAVTQLKGGSMLHVKVQETVFHPGHYRVALARTPVQLPADPAVTTRDSERGPWSVSAAIQNPTMPPVLVDGLFPHTERATGAFETDIAIPNVNCPNCVLQVIQFMAEHARNADGDFSYHHCATVQITADASKPIDTRWAGLVAGGLQPSGAAGLQGGTVAGAPQGAGAQANAQPAPAREVTVSAIPGVVAAGAKWQLVWGGSDNADGLVGTPDGGVLFAQEQPKRISKLDKNGKLTTFVENTHGAGSVAMDARERLLVVERTCTDPGLRLASPCAEPTRISVIYPEKERKVLADSIDGKDLGRLNDLVVAKNGHIYFTSNGAFHLTPAGKVEAIGANLRTNGIMLSPDEKTLYVTNGSGVVAFDVQADGSVKNQRDFAKLETGNGDGLAVDAEGRLYVTSMAAGVQVFGPDGKALGTIPTPRAVISAAFSGPDKKTLYVVGSGAVDSSGKEMTTAAGVRNNAKSIYKLDMVAQGFRGRAK